MIEEKINFLFMFIEIVFGLIAIFLIIQVYGFVRRNLGLDKQTKEPKKIREIVEQNLENELERKSRIIRVFSIYFKIFAFSNWDTSKLRRC